MENTNKLLMCEGCHQDISSNEHIACRKCGLNYDLECANISEKRNTSSADLKKKMWICPVCTTKNTRRNNENTPACSDSIVKIKTTSQDPNVTLRKPMPSGKQLLTELENNDASSFYELSTFDESVLGDTINNHAPLTTQERAPVPTFTLDQLSQLLDKKLENNENKIVSLIKIELKALIQEEIKNSMSNLSTDITNKLNTINIEQNKQSNDINKLTTKINSLEEECDRLNNEIKSLQNLCHNNKPIHNNSNSTKKLVLYGLEQSNWETEDELYDRILCIFYENMNVYLEGHIDEITRLGKRGYRRPIVIELLSKQMTRYILQNKHLLRGSGVVLEEFLENEALQKRNTLRKILQEARRDGHHAVIRNNSLIIDGQIYNNLANLNNEIKPPNTPISMTPGKPYASDIETTTQNNHDKSNDSLRSNPTLNTGNHSFRN